MKRFLALASIIFLASCASYKFDKEPVNISDTLIVGKVLLQVTESDVNRIPVGEYTRKMTVHLKNLEDGNVSKISDIESDGYFYTHSLKAGTYHVKKIVLEDSKKGMIWIDPNMSDVFTVEEGKVNNLGRLKWMAGISDGTRHTQFFSGQNEVKDFFTKENPSSLWLEKEWVDAKNLISLR